MDNLNKKEILTILAIGALIISVIVYYIYTLTQANDYSELEKEERKIAAEEEISTEEIIIHIAGEVNNPGVIRIKKGARIADIVEKAGGLTEKANITNVNLAYEIEDGQKIIIPSINKETEQEEYITNDSGKDIIQENNNEANKKININTAKQSELATLPGIGESIALKIIIYREQNGKYNSIEDIKNVQGIGDSKYENIKEYITVK